MMSIPSEQHILDFFKGSSRQQSTIKSMIQQFVIPADLRPAFRRRVRKMAATGALVHVRGTRYALPERLDMIGGTIKRHEDGYGFLVPDDLTQEDIYVGRSDMQGVMHEDRAMVRLDTSQRRDKRRSGRVEHIFERVHHDVVGRVTLVGKTCWLMPMDARLCPQIAIPSKLRNSARPGEIAVAEITRYDLGHEHPQGQITEILGEADDPELEIELIQRRYDLPHAFPPDVEAAADAIPTAVQSHDLAGRRDLRPLITVTIDGETARDFDDAVSLEGLPNGHLRLGVHIADVSYYVTENSELDRVAYQRSTSVYFPNHVIPMLPTRLSNEVCSLQPGVDRLTLSAVMELTATGDVHQYEIVPSVICSQARLTYRQVADYFAGKAHCVSPWRAEIGAVLDQMLTLAQALRHRRMAAGSLDFDFPEAEVVLNDAGGVDTIVCREHGWSNRLIEEFMLLANHTVASHLAMLEGPALYRVHPPPDPTKIEQFNEVVRSLGIAVDRDAELTPQAVQAVLEAVQGRPEEPLVNQLLLRAMQRAHYDHQLGDHFGLAFAAYTHFTSPIRRYPDLIVHRLLRAAAVSGGMLPEQAEGWDRRLPGIASHTSSQERRADEASREVVEVYQAAFMRDRLGQEYEGAITGVTPFGLFIGLDTLFVEGLVHVNWLPGWFEFDAARFCLIGPPSGPTYCLGDRVRVRVDNVNLHRRQIDFFLLAKLPSAI